MQKSLSLEKNGLKSPQKKPRTHWLLGRVKEQTLMCGSKQTTEKIHNKLKLRSVKTSRSIGGSFMNNYIHYVLGFCEHNQEADDGFTKLIANGLPPERVKIYKHHSPTHAHEFTEGNNEVLKDILVDGTIWCRSGNRSWCVDRSRSDGDQCYFICGQPLNCPPLVLLGWEAIIGGVVGASIDTAGNHTRYITE